MANDGDTFQVGFGSDVANESTEMLTISRYIADDGVTLRLEANHMWMRFRSDDSQRHRGAYVDVRRLAETGRPNR